ncbi:XP motif-containing protein [Cryptosporidium felis]|nr:XP motif-containing protein [Cryptosporidium felis]
MYLYNDTAALPASRTGKPTTAPHGFVPLFDSGTKNRTSALPASRTGIQTDLRHSYIPLLSEIGGEEHAAKPASRTSVPAPGTSTENLPFTILVSFPKSALPASRTDFISDSHSFIPLMKEREDLGPRAAFPATHTTVKAPGAPLQKGIEWEHYTEILKVDSDGNPYVDTCKGRIYGFGDLSTILSLLDQDEALESGSQQIIPRC